MTDTLKDGAQYRGGGVRRRTATPDKGQHDEGMESKDMVGVSFHSVQLEVKFKAGSEERPGRSGPRAQFWKS